jgi:hypothetical protein
MNPLFPCFLPNDPEIVSNLRLIFLLIYDKSKDFNNNSFSKSKNSFYNYVRQKSIIRSITQVRHRRRFISRKILSFAQVCRRPIQRKLHDNHRC